jgi:hypothetical protein
MAWMIGFGVFYRSISRSTVILTPHQSVDQQICGISSLNQ